MVKNYHFIGIGGIGMSGLARLLLSQKKSVTGSDIAFNPTIENLIREGAVIYKGHKAENVPLDSKVIYTSDVKSDNPEYQAAIKKQCVIQHRSDLLAELLHGHHSLAVAGTHGKTTTSSLLATVLVDSKLDPSFAIGGMLPAFHSNSRLGKGDLFVFEADESDCSFLKFHPFGAIITNIDNDHLINYENSFDVLIEAFSKFISQVQFSQYLFWCRDDPYLTQLNPTGQSYGFHEQSDWKIVATHQEGFILCFDLEHQGQIYRQIELSLVGHHNVLNAAAVFGLCMTLEVPETTIRQAFKNFKGVLRRCENKGTFNGALFLDDYAHHPTEIRTTLQGIRQAIGSKRLVAVFQPHRYSRTQDCLGQYGSIFEAADEILITDIYGAGETPIPHLSHALIQEEIQLNSSVPCRYVRRADLSHYLCQLVQPDDVVITLGAGDITKLGDETLCMLEKESLQQIHTR
jgi:UDP-N-acetylmuramate--alanine ligase